ncbi:MAG TPA: SRPBCC family protein [Candidatus Limnocylindria bacterium]|nr:SRPBCC family protein [Candidatus Limnocylindria bacterium]
MRRVTATAIVPAPPDRVFAFLSDLEQLPRWQSGIVSAEVTTPGPLGAGSQAHVVRELMGQRIEVDVTATGYEPHRWLALESEASGIGVRASLELEPAGAGTQLGFSMEIRAKSLFMAPLEGIVAGAAQQDVADSLERVRAHFEAERLVP